MQKAVKWCFECKAGEHDNYDDEVLLTVVRDPDTNKVVKRGYICRDHRCMLEDDGYDLQYV